MKIDLNCDMGESFGRYTVGNDQSIMPFITSANLACGMHAGDPLVIGQTVRLAKQYGVAIGAHPGWPDLQGFGRREMSFNPEETEALVLYQIGTLYAFTKSEGAELHHVKPHGALYNQAVKDRNLAKAIAGAVKRFSSDLILVGLAGSGLIEAGVEAGLHIANEGFPDRTYTTDGTLTPREQADAIIESPEEVAAHAVRLAQQGVDFSGRRVRLDTLCLHGDHPRAAQNAKLVRETLEKSEIKIAAL